MWNGRLRISLLICAGLCLGAATLAASEQKGSVTFNGLPVPGAIVTATRDGKKFTAITNAQGAYDFPDLSDGIWTIQVEMLGFLPVKAQITAVQGAPAGNWELKMLPLAEIHAIAQSAALLPPQAPANPGPAEEQKPASAPPPQAPPPNQDELQQRAADGLLINGSENNAASSPFALAPAFGNNRGGRGLYNGALGVYVDNSIWDARSFSLTGQNTPKPGYNHLTAIASFGGPLRIPHLLPNGPNFFVGYQWVRDRNAAVDTALMPTAAERGGDLSQLSNMIVDPLNGGTFPGNVIPKSRLSPQAQALLGLYPLPNFGTGSGYNYQIPVTGVEHQDSLQSRLNQFINPRNQAYGNFAFQSTRKDDPNVFGFLDTTDTFGLTANANWMHRFAQGFFSTFGVQYSRFSSRITPNFQNRSNVSGNAGILGNDQSPLDWGPPNLSFASIMGLTDPEQSFNRNQTAGVSYAGFWNHFRHNLQFGGGFKKQQFNLLGQQNGRGSFTFTGAASGSDFADFLLGIPDAAQVAFGNADKYFRDSLYDLYFTDDWRINSTFTLNAGLRWEYGSPITELYGRLVNLDVAPGFSNEVPVVANSPIGPLTGLHYPDSLIHPDRHAFEPRVAIAWRPLAASSLVVRAGYGVYYDTSVYETIATQMSQQYPLSKSLSVQNTPQTPLTLANGFNTVPTGTLNTFGIDPNFRPGYAQNWQVSVQRDLPGSLQLTATYLGIKGTHGTQEFYPNTYAPGGVNPCPLCPAGYAYITSNGNSTREAGEFQLRRRLHNGFTASVLYTFAKAIDDDAVLGGPAAAASTLTPPVPGAAAASNVRNLAVAQNWLNLAAERSLSGFDQRHLVNIQLQYTTGQGIAGGTLLSGWKGALLKEWTFLSSIAAGSGLPLTPVYLAPIPGTGFSGIRPDYTGASLYSAQPGRYLNAAAFTAPPPGQWGNAGRNSITGPSQFTFNASIGRTFRLTDRLNGDLQIVSTNPINHVTFPSWNTTLGPEFGLANAANPMRSLTTRFIVRF